MDINQHVLLLELTVLREILPHVLRIAEVEAVQNLVTEDDTIGLQWGAPAYQHRGGVQSTQLQFLWWCGGP